MKIRVEYSYGTNETGWSHYRGAIIGYAGDAKGRVVAIILRDEFQKDREKAEKGCFTPCPPVLESEWLGDLTVISIDGEGLHS